MPMRESLHTLVEMLADYRVFDGAKVTIEVVDGKTVGWREEPMTEQMAPPPVAITYVERLH